jgi:peptide/nickel transport system substrate-binding protein
MSGDCLSKKLADGKEPQLDYTFTSAGDTKDHPAYTMFTMAAADLNQAGMKIKVKTDVQALSKLANGSLTVWAAAWGSAIDPDMYQVYHKNSQATSVNNWGYDVILTDSTGLYDTEKAIINQLSKAIDNGRSYLDEDVRATYYSEALDLVMDLAVELPTYQRKNLLVYNSAKIDASSLNQDEITAYQGLIEKIWDLKLN